MENEGSFLGYGSPEALEQAIKKDESSEFQVHEGIAYARVCTSLSKEEAVARMRRRPSGTSHGWVFADEPFSDATPNPCPCDKLPNHTHYLFAC